MRCIESLIHLCAMGMFDETDIHLLALDTDKNNGNFARLRDLKEAYVHTKAEKASDQVALKDTFFSANIKYYEFSPNYEEDSSFEKVFNYGDTQYNHREETDLADLVLDKNVREFNLRHGYRAQTHLGSMMMYHSIVQGARSDSQNGLKDFVQTLLNVSGTEPARVFILGSVFGGTGASSIPIIPQALSQAAKIVSNGTADLLRNTYFGSTLLTAYFTFTAPDSEQLLRQKVIATSEKFALNSQVAMMFYDDDVTVKSTYQCFYMMGTDGLTWNPMPSSFGKTLTGGSEQKNDSHYIELLAAFAARDFLSIEDEELRRRKEHNETRYLYRAIDESGTLDFVDFAGKEGQTEFAKKLGCLVAFGLFNNGNDDFVEKARSGEDKEITGYEDIAPAQVRSLRTYFQLFFAQADETGHLMDGWLRQLNRSAEEKPFLLNSKLFVPQTKKDLMRLDWNKSLYRAEGIGKDHTFSTGLIGSKFNSFKKMFLQEADNETEISNPGERIYKAIYDTLTKLYDFK